jgi:hypothetical protein
MNCKECAVTFRCVNDGDRGGAAKYYPCSRDTFYDAKHSFCDRENAGVVAHVCYGCRKCVCKNTDECNSPRREMSECLT